MDFAIFYFINFIFMECVFHFYFWKDLHIMILPIIAMAAFVALLQALILDFIKGKAKNVFFWIFLALNYLTYGTQLVYYSIFKQPLLLDAVFVAGGDALTNYWRETFVGIWNASLGLLALFFGIAWIIAVTIVYKKSKSTKLKVSEADAVATEVDLLALETETEVNTETNEKKSNIKKYIVIRIGGMLAAIALFTGTFFGLYKLSPDAYEDYQSFGYPAGVLEEYGVLPFAMRDMGIIWLPQYEEDFTPAFGDDVIAETETSTTETTEIPVATPEPTTPPPAEHVLNVNYDYLKEIGSDEVDSVTDLVFAMEPTTENDYTGLFEGYNLIHITAEGFSTAAVDPVLTPTLYQLTHSGIVVPEYYVPLWQTSTSDGEYVNLTGLIPDQQFSMKRTAENEQPYSLANYFKSEGAVCYAYHNNTLSYYDRHLSHPNLGYNFKASKLGELTQEEWGSQIFAMEHPNYWPASDLEMMQATVQEYVHEERFHVYYLTVSGHMNYDFRGNKMSSLHADKVQNLTYSEEGKAYIACNIELDRAISYLIGELYAAGKLENTVICLSADHYPYAMNVSNYEELTGMSNLENSLDIYRNSLILWNSQMETVTVNEPCSSMDLIPTLLNLFGFEYDSRLFSGRDIFSDKAPLVVFSNRSFITDKASYNKKTGEVISRTGEEVSEEYVENMKKYVRMLHKHSAGILNNNYYKYFNESVDK